MPHPDAPAAIRWPSELIGMALRDWRQLSAEKRSTYWKSLGTAIVVTLLTTVLLVWAVNALESSGRLAWEKQWLETYLANNDFTIWQAIWMNNFGHVYVFLLLVLFVAVQLVRDHRPMMALTFGGTFFGASFFTVVGWNIWNRVRPDFVLDGVIIPDIHSFPSGHTAQSISVFIMLAYVWSRYTTNRAEKVLAFVMASIIAGMVVLGRILLGAHWPTDLMAGGIIGFVWVLSLIGVVRSVDHS